MARLRKVEQVKKAQGWSFRVNCALPGDKEANYHTYDTKEEAATVLAEINSQILKYSAHRVNALTQTRTAIDVAWAMFENQRLKNLELNTKKTYKTAFSRILGKLAFVDQINKAWIDEELSGSQIRKSTAWKYYTCWSTFLDWCKNKSFKVAPDYTEWDIDAYVGIKKKQKSWFTHEQFKSVIANLETKTPYCAVICRLCGYFGLRIDEAISMLRHQVDVNSGVITVFGKGEGEEGKKERHIPVGNDIAKNIMDKSDELYAKHQKICVTHSPLWIEERKGCKLTYATVVKRWIVAVTKAGLDHHSYSTHSMRRYSYLYLHDLGVDYEAIKQIVGHNSEAYNLYIGNITNQLLKVTGRIVI